MAYAIFANDAGELDLPSEEDLYFLRGAAVSSRGPTFLEPAERAKPSLSRTLNMHRSPLSCGLPGWELIRMDGVRFLGFDYTGRLRIWIAGGQLVGSGRALGILCGPKKVEDWDAVFCGLITPADG